MIEYIKGKLEYITQDYIVVETKDGIGYKIIVSSSAISHLPPLGKEVKIYISMISKDDGITLYGFLSREQLTLFNKLITVSGVGPKGALGIFKDLSPQDVITAIVTGDIKTLCGASGIGKKTAQRIVLDLKDKFSSEYIMDSIIDNSTMSESSSWARQEAIEALCALGYSMNESVRAVNAVKEECRTEELLKKALKNLSR